VGEEYKKEDEEMEEDDKKKGDMLFGHVCNFLNFVTADDNTFLSGKNGTHAKP
jgi:hypothetical protein